MKDILLIGGGGHCKAIIDVIEQEAKYNIVGIIDKPELIGQKILGYKIIGCDDDLKELRGKFLHAIITVGHIKSNALRIRLFRFLKELDFNIPVIISPFAYVSKHAHADEGTVVMHYAVVNADAKIGKNCIINTKALVEHDSSVENHCHISTSAVVNGGVIVKENTFLGSNATTKEYTEIDGFIKAGSLVK